MSELRKRTAINIGFNGMAVFANSVFQFIASIILARLLLPADYGIVGFALILINFMAQFSDFGIGSALIQKAEANDDLVYTGFALKTIASVLAFIIVFSLAPVFRILSESREIALAIRGLSFGFLISIFSFLPQISLTRELRFKELAYPQVMGGMAGSFCAVALAYTGFGFWSFIGGHIINSFVIAAALNLIRPMRFRMHYEREHGWDILVFGSHIIVPGVISFLIFNTDNFAIGALRGSEQLGYYTMAFNLGSLICLLLANVVHQVLFPTFSKFQHDLKAIKSAYLDSMHYVAFLAVPINLFLMVLGKEFISHVLGGKWMPALTALQVLCFYGVSRALLEPLANVIVGIGKPRLFIRTSLTVAVIQLILLYPSLKFWGIEGVAVAVTISYISQYFVCVPLIKQEIGVNLGEAWSAIQPAILAFLMALPVVILLKTRFESSLPVLVVEAVIGGAGYFVIYGKLTGWQILRELWEMVHPS